MARMTRGALRLRAVVTSVGIGLGMIFLAVIVTAIGFGLFAADVQTESADAASQGTSAQTAQAQTAELGARSVVLAGFVLTAVGIFFGAASLFVYYRTLQSHDQTEKLAEEAEESAKGVSTAAQSA